MMMGAAIFIYLAFRNGPGIGIESTQTCGVEYSTDFTYYTELLRSWPILLVPYMVHKCLRLTLNIPGFVIGSFLYYKS
jgi:hypothetical protein